MPQEDTTFYVVQTLDWFLRKDFTYSRAPSQNYVKRSFIDSKEATNNVVSRESTFHKEIWRMVWYKACVLAALKKERDFARHLRSQRLHNDQRFLGDWGNT